MTRKLWLSCTFITGQVDVIDGRIVAAPPIWRKFIGQPIENLTRWLSNKQLRSEEL